jgi:hypothetical protein
MYVEIDAVWFVSIDHDNLNSFFLSKFSMHTVYNPLELFLFMKICLILILLMWRIRWAPNNASRWQIGFNFSFKGLIFIIIIIIIYLSCSWATCWPVPVSRIQKSL